MIMALALLHSIAEVGQGAVVHRPGYDGHSCVVRVKGKPMLVGEDRCLLPQRRSRLSGFVVIGLEELCFMHKLDLAVVKGNAPCSIALSGQPQRLKVGSDGFRKLYKADLIVAGDGMRGFYGSGGITPFGYYVVNVRSLQFLRTL